MRAMLCRCPFVNPSRAAIPSGQASDLQQIRVLTVTYKTPQQSVYKGDMLKHPPFVLHNPAQFKALAMANGSDNMRLLWQRKYWRANLKTSGRIHRFGVTILQNNRGTDRGIRARLYVQKRASEGGWEVQGPTPARILPNRSEALQTRNMKGTKRSPASLSSSQ